MLCLGVEHLGRDVSRGCGGHGRGPVVGPPWTGVLNLWVSSRLVGKDNEGLTMISCSVVQVLGKRRGKQTKETFFFCCWGEEGDLRGGQVPTVDKNKNELNQR